MVDALSDAFWVAGEPYDYGADGSGYYESHRNHIVFKQFKLAKPVTGKAELFVAAMGYVRVLINGARADDSELLGWWTNYSKTVYAHRIDVTNYLLPGDNVIEMELGNGFYNPAPLTLFGKYNLRDRLAEVGTPRVASSLVIPSQDISIATDESWKVKDGNVLFNNVYLGERVDLRLSGDNCRAVTVYGPASRVELSPAAPCTVRKVIPVVNIDSFEDGVLLDFGEVVSGFIELGFLADEGSIVGITYYEGVEGGIPCLTTNVAGYVGVETPRGLCPGGPGAPAMALQSDEVVCRSGCNEFINKHTWHSFRYAHVRGLSRERILRARALQVCTRLDDASTIRLGNEEFERLHAAAVLTKLNNIHGVFEDCSRERFGYGGDMVALSDSEISTFDVSGMIDKTLADFHRDQTPRGGLPETAPFMGIGSNGPAYGEGPLLWQLAYPYLAIQADRYYGRSDLLLREWPGIELFGSYLLSFDFDWLSSCCLGDHGSLASGEDFKTSTPDKRFVGWCSIYWGLLLVCEAADRLGKKSDRYRSAASSVRDEIVKRFANRDGSYGEGTQTALAFAAALGLGNERELASRLADKIKAENGVLQTGIFGTKFAFDVLARCGHSAVLEQWLLRRESPSLLSMLASENGTLVEQFDDPLASLNHAMFSSFDHWFVAGLAGIRVENEARGCDKVLIAPYFSNRTNEVDCGLKTPRGVIAVCWRRSGKNVELRLDVPKGIDFSIIAPKDYEELCRDVEGDAMVVTYGLADN